MQINPTTSISPVATVDRTATSTHTQPKAPDPVTKVKAPDPTIAHPKVFTPAPPLRPNVQDYVDIDRTLLALSPRT